MEIKNFLINQNFFQKSYDDKGLSVIEVSKQDVIDYKKEIQTNLPTNFEYRKNQLEVIQHLKTNGFVTGIHLEST